MDSLSTVVWVESPLQLVAAAEWASGQDRRVVVAHRLTGPQMQNTAAELLARGARFSACIPYFGIPWQLLSSHPHWVVGDAFSGQFRLAASVLRPRSMTLVDDGAHSLAVADALLGRTSYARPHVSESSLSGLLGGLARDRMLRLAARERLTIATAFPFGDGRTSGLESLGVTVTRHRLDWIRSTAAPQALPSDRVLLGSAWPTDERISPERYLAWIAAEAAEGTVAYLPHRRESAWLLRAVSEIPHVVVHETGLPVELVLAGTRRQLELISLASSAQVTLGHLLEGTGSVLRTGSLVARVPNESRRVVTRDERDISPGARRG